MYKSRRRVDKSQSDNGWKKGLVGFFFSCLCWELSSNSYGMAGGRTPNSLGSGAWKLSPGGSQACARGGGLAPAVTLVLEQQIFLLLETLPVLTAIRSYSNQLEWR